MLVEGKEVLELQQHKKNPDYNSEKRQIFIIGSKGIPAAYGGFETFVEELTANQVSSQLRYHISRLSDNSSRFEYNGAKCFNVKVPNIGAAKAIYYDVKALKQCIEYCERRPSIERPIFYILACRIGPFIRHYARRIHKLGGELYINPDGHEWKRSKWSAPVRAYWKYSEKFMVKHADLLICDSIGIEEYIQKTYKKYSPNTIFIAYGSDTTPSVLEDTDEKYNKWLKDKNLIPDDYYLIVGRFVPENNFETMIREFMLSNSKKSLAIITTANETFLAQLEDRLRFRGDSRIKFVGTVYDKQLLKKIRENAFGYLHGHEVGGTNPSLLEALGSTKLNLLLDVCFNKEVGGDTALYWSKEQGNLSKLIDETDRLHLADRTAWGKKAKERIENNYSWEYIVAEYEKVFLNRWPEENCRKSVPELIDKSSIPTCRILGVDIAAVNMKWTVDFIEANLEKLSGDYICVSNVHTTVTAFENREYRLIQNGGILAIPDGGPLSSVGHKRGYLEMNRTTGPSLMEEIFAISVEKGYRHFFYGATESTLKDLKMALEKQYPGIDIAGMYSPPFHSMTAYEDSDVCKMINESKPDFVWVGLGAPKQERWMAEHMGKIDGLMIGVGAAFDYLAGNLSRAPKWMQDSNLEWFYRLKQEPKRLFNRYWNTNWKFIWFAYFLGK